MGVPVRCRAGVVLDATPGVPTMPGVPMAPAGAGEGGACVGASAGAPAFMKAWMGTLTISPPKLKFS